MFININLKAGIITLLLTLCGISSVQAQTFISFTSSVADNAILNVAFTETGLTVGLAVTYTLSADFSKTWACIAGKKKIKSTIIQQGNVVQEGSGSFGPNSAGFVSATVFGNPLSSEVTCPKQNQTAVLACISYTNIILTDTRNSVSVNPADVSRSFLAGVECFPK